MMLLATVAGKCNRDPYLRRHPHFLLTPQSSSNAPWDNCDLVLMPHNSGMSIYDEIRFLEGCSYNEKLRMWTRKKAAAAAASTKERKRLEQQDTAPANVHKAVAGPQGFGDNWMPLILMEDPAVVPISRRLKGWRKVGMAA